MAMAFALHMFSKDVQRQDNMQVEDREFSKKGAGIRRLFWQLLLVSCAVGATYSISKVVADILEQPMAIRISTKLATNMTLPEIMVCTSIALNITKLGLLGIPKEVQELMQWHFYQETRTQLEVASVDEKRLNDPEIAKYFEVDWYNFMLENGIQCEQVMKTCVVTYTHKLDCCSATQPTAHEKQGLCHKFKQPIVLQQTGINAGLTMFLTTPSVQNFTSVASFASGLQIEYDEAIVPPLTANHPRIFIPADKSVAVAFSATHRIRQDTDASPCRTLRAKHYVECFGEIMKTYCNCWLLGFKNDINDPMPTCLPGQTITCFNHNYSRIHETATVCYQKNAMPQCNEWVYTPHVTYVDLQLNAKLRQKSDVLKGAKTLSRVQLYYERLEYTLIEEFTILNFENVVGQLGGIMSLWLGLSILSISQYGAKFIRKLMRLGNIMQYATTKEEVSCSNCGNEISKDFWDKRLSQPRLSMFEVKAARAKERKMRVETNVTALD